MTTGGQNGIYATINITPMIDVLLVLLILFMVLTPLAPVGLKAAIPQEGPASEEPAQPPLVVQVEGNGMTRVNSQPVPVAELRTKLDSIFHARPGSIVFVDGVGDLEFGDVAHVIDIVRGAGIGTVGLLPHKREESNQVMF